MPTNGNSRGGLPEKERKKKSRKVVTVSKLRAIDWPCLNMPNNSLDGQWKA